MPGSTNFVDANSVSKNSAHAINDRINLCSPAAYLVRMWRDYENTRLVRWHLVDTTCSNLSKKNSGNDFERVLDKLIRQSALKVLTSVASTGQFRRRHFVTEQRIENRKSCCEDE
ncbi:hypothetical protein INT43_001812 [Umbelopsis isabellina]|uniref:Uncharacterized protein n=1 Tax=Mortierella isabellina TaxID=91625 RepID=A0A8H7PSH7_MORIS|nr:hypothetical protein INT43_001812 [Umbelopsis isabellina]